VFVREKRINGYTYLCLVETVREDGRAKQRIIKNLGRKEAVVASGGLERLAASVARYAERTVVLSQLETGNPHHLACRRVGAPLLFGQLWERAGRPGPRPSPRAPSRTWSRSGCSRGGATSSPSSPWCAWTPPRSASTARA